ncbi:MAG: tripartite tricarboxylate transporter substrate binding protein [Rhodovarius sp.]|nr:tripartite tricarboxylate transporter substrate binding protein [Rhodovarius sp.]MCX7932461.1 tripartite tricarboxylate transporter substrate binding protein [Rhodovarius sp.]
MVTRRLALSLPFLAAPALAQSFPERTVRYIVPFPPAGLTDMMARIIGNRLAEVWGKPVVIENRPGGNAMIGADAAAKSPPDGHTLLAITMTHTVNVTLFPNAPYDLLRDLTPISVLGSLPLLVVVNANSPVRSVDELAALARSRTLNAGSSGNGSPPHLGIELFRIASRAGANITHVPYRGGAPSVTDLVAGNLDFMVSNLPECIGQVQAGRLRALATTGETRHRLLPDVPTVREVGMPSLTMTNWTAMLVPSGTPEPIRRQIEEATLRVAREPATAQRIIDAGFDLEARDSAASAAFIRAEVQRWGQLVREAGIRPDA